LVAQAARQLMEMGFNRYDVAEALRVTMNDQNAACAWLLGDRDGAGQFPDDDLLHDEPAVDFNHPVIRTVMGNARLMSMLTNPRVNQSTPAQLISVMVKWRNCSRQLPSLMLAVHAIVLLEVINQPNRVGEFVTDPDAGPAIREIWDLLRSTLDGN